MQKLLDSEPRRAVSSNSARSSNGDLPDYLIGQIAAEQGCELTVTF
jgi:hypothetical protein